MIRSTQVSHRSALNWSPLQTRQWADKKRMAENCTPFQALISVRITIAGNAGNGRLSQSVCCC